MLSKGEVMKALEPVVAELKPDRVTGVGNVNSTLAGPLVCGKLGVPAAPVEGRASFRRSVHAGSSESVAYRPAR